MTILVRAVLAGGLLASSGMGQTGDLSAKDKPRPLSKRGLENRQALARLFGYLHYFHPSDGMAMSFGVERLLNSLFNTGGVDIVVYIAVVPSMVIVTMLAAYVPARRAARIAPTQALRYE